MVPEKCLLNDRRCDELSRGDQFPTLQLYDLFNFLVKSGHKVRVIFVTGHWVDVDGLDDLERAQEF
jgi:phosphoenolpyruvate phosphomutase